MSHKYSKIIKIILLVIIGIVLLRCGLVLFKKGCLNYYEEQIEYNENNDIDYKVYLKENNFFEKPYLEKNNIYITSLIDYIDITFNYDMKLEKEVSGFYKYSIKGIISANPQNNENNNYWKKEYILSEEKIVSYQNLKEIDFDSTVKFDYQYYNELLQEFKKDFNLSLDGSFKVILSVENVINSEVSDTGISKVSISTLTIPLTKATIEVPIKIETNQGKGILNSELVIFKDSVYFLYKLFGIILMIGSAFVFICIGLYIVKKREKQSIYKKQLNKILKTYDSIIVNITRNIDTEGLSIIAVDSFSELIDAHSEVRLPINYIENENESIFILIQGKMAWRYILKK